MSYVLKKSGKLVDTPIKKKIIPIELTPHLKMIMDHKYGQEFNHI